MAPLSITVPSTTVAQHPKPHTLYTLSITLPLTTTTTTKRYSDFTSLDALLRSQATTSTKPPPALPPKHLLKSTVNNPLLTETRRRGLESYLQTILEDADATYRSTPAFREFLNLPASVSLTNTPTQQGTSKATARRALEDEIRDPGVWLDAHRDLKSQLREIRGLIAERERSEAPGTVHSKSGEARGLLVDARRKVAILENGITELGVGEGEMRRRRDLTRNLGKDIEALERDLDAPLHKVDEGEGPATPALDGQGGEKKALFSGRGRVLGGPAKETEKTQSLDNEGVLQLQKQIMEDQDMDVGELTKNVRRLKEMGVQINEELDLQTQMLDLVDQDVDRLQGKIGVAKKRIGKLR